MKLHLRAVFSCLIFASAAAAFTSYHLKDGRQSVLTRLSAQTQPSDKAVSRRRALGVISTFPVFWAFQNDASYAAAKIKTGDAFAALVKARQELSLATEKYVVKGDWEGLRAYLEEEAVNMNSYEANAGALLASKSLDAESKKDIGTIRRYGVGADVIIMYGGLKNEVSEENESISSAEVGKYLKRTTDSLDEVIAICRSNGF